VLRAIDNLTIDHRGPAFAQLGREVLAGSGVDAAMERLTLEPVAV